MTNMKNVWKMKNKHFDTLFVNFSFVKHFSCVHESCENVNVLSNSIQYLFNCIKLHVHVYLHVLELADKIRCKKATTILLHVLIYLHDQVCL